MTAAVSAQQLFWITIGAVIAVWEMSGAMRAIMAVLDRIYGADRERSFRERQVVAAMVQLLGVARPLAVLAGPVPLSVAMFQYFYLAACAFLTGAVLDAILRARAA